MKKLFLLCSITINLAYSKPTTISINNISLPTILHARDKGYDIACILSTTNTPNSTNYGYECVPYYNNKKLSQKELTNNQAELCKLIELRLEPILARELTNTCSVLSNGTIKFDLEIPLLPNKQDFLKSLKD